MTSHFAISRIKKAKKKRRYKTPEITLTTEMAQKLCVKLHLDAFTQFIAAERALNTFTLQLHNMQLMF